MISDKPKTMNRRHFLKNLAAAGLAVSVLPKIADAAETAAEILTKTTAQTNPLLAQTILPNGFPPLHKIKPEHFEQALEQLFKEMNATVEQITKNPQAPTFENTVLPLEIAASRIDEVGYLALFLDNAKIDPRMAKVNQESRVKLQKYLNAIFTRDDLFERVNFVNQHKNELNLDDEQSELVFKTHQAFPASHSPTSSASKEQISAIDTEINKARAQYQDDQDTAQKQYFRIVTDRKMLEGLSEETIQMMKEKAAESGQQGYKIVYDDVFAIRDECANREMRKMAVIDRWNCCDKDGPTATKILELRHEKAKLLGHDNFIDSVIERSPLKNAAGIAQFIDEQSQELSQKNIPYMQEIEAFAQKRDGLDKLAFWDVDYYMNELIKDRLPKDAGNMSDYVIDFDNAVKVVHDCAERSFGVKITEATKTYPLPIPEAKVYEISDTKSGKILGLCCEDLLASKSGSPKLTCASYLKTSHIENGKEQLPILSVSMDVSNAERTNASLPRTIRYLFHEFGHAMNGVLRHGKFSTVTQIDEKNDYTEFFSQAFEYQTKAAVLQQLYRHKETGAPLPEKLALAIEEQEEMRATVALSWKLSFSKMDNEIHRIKRSPESFAQIERDALAQNGRPSSEEGHIITGMPHMFALDSGYAGKMVGYAFSEVLAGKARKNFNPNIPPSVNEQIINREAYASIMPSRQQELVDTLTQKKPDQQDNGPKQMSRIGPQVKNFLKRFSPG